MRVEHSFKHARTMENYVRKSDQIGISLFRPDPQGWSKQIIASQKGV